jgi:hypothetical protein
MRGKDRHFRDTFGLAAPEPVEPETTMSSAKNDSIRTYFWMVHYDVSPPPADGLQPIPAGRKRGIWVYSRNTYANQAVDFRMPRENEGGTPDPAMYRGSADLRNRILGFYASPEEANAHIDEVWGQMQARCGAIYAELYSMRLDTAQELKLAA